MAKFLLPLAALIVLVAGAVFFRSLSAPMAPAGRAEVGPLQGTVVPVVPSGGLAAASAGRSAGAPGSAAETTAPSVPPVSRLGASRVDGGEGKSVPATNTFVGPDGGLYEIPPASAELVALGDVNLRAAVMDEIRSDPQAFAQAMGVELEDVQRVADGKSEVPPRWIVQ